VKIPKLTYGNLFIGLIILHQVAFHILTGIGPLELGWTEPESVVSDWEMFTMVIYLTIGLTGIAFLIMQLIENWDETIKF
jgi:hypothetical protein